MLVKQRYAAFAEGTVYVRTVQISSFVLLTSKDRPEGDLTLFRTVDRYFVHLQPIRDPDTRQRITHLKLLRAPKDEDLKLFWQHSIGDINDRRGSRTQLYLCWRSEILS